MSEKALTRILQILVVAMLAGAIASCLMGSSNPQQSHCFTPGEAHTSDMQPCVRVDE